MSSSSRTLVLPSLLLAFPLTLLALRAGAGPLDPPAGPISPTHKTLTEVEPRIAINAVNTPGDSDATTPSLFKITQPGSYYLTGNIVGVAGNRTAIEIAAADVTLDLNGFALIGTASSGVAAGIRSTGFLSTVTVRNGSVVDWPSSGIDLSTFHGCCVSDVVASLNGVGVQVGSGSRVERCTADTNGGTGIDANSGGMIIDCEARDNAGTGIDGGTGTTISRCTAYTNNIGITISSGGTVLDSTAYANGSNGMNAGSGSTIARCTAYLNTGNGIFAAVGTSVTGCTARSNESNGIAAAAGCLVRDNTCIFPAQWDPKLGIHVT